MGGQVVHARRGERDAYRPIRSELVAGSEPLAITSALLALAPFRRLYVADLDAIRGRGSHDGVIAGIAGTFRDLEIWVDRGETDVLDMRRRAKTGPGVSVVGTESFTDVFAVKRALGAGEAILSLDHDAGGRLGPPEIHEDARLWPQRVVVMTLARVGASGGPDVERLAEVIGRAGAKREVFAAGGVRGLDDLLDLRALGASGVLVASALHDGRLTRHELRQVAATSRRTAPRP